MNIERKMINIAFLIKLLVLGILKETYSILRNSFCAFINFKVTTYHNYLLYAFISVPSTKPAMSPRLWRKIKVYLMKMIDSRIFSVV